MRVLPHRLATGWRTLSQQLLHLNQESPAAADSTTELTTSLPPEVPTNEQPKRSARIRERQGRRDEFGDVATDTVELETCCLAD